MAKGLLSFPHEKMRNEACLGPVRRHLFALSLSTCSHSKVTDGSMLW